MGAVGSRLEQQLLPPPSGINTLPGWATALGVIAGSVFNLKVRTVAGLPRVSGGRKPGSPSGLDPDVS